MAQSSIEWTEATWNPVTGCDKVSPGCKYCYAEVMARRLKGMGQPNYRNGFELTLQPHMMDRPLTWRRPRMIFVNSMSDLFHEDVPLEYIRRVFATIGQAHWHTFQVLTKRAARLEAVAARLDWPANLWMGVSVERQDYAFRIEHLKRTPARTKFLSLEPLLGPLTDLDLGRIDWVIVGGESGHAARTMKEAWVADIQAQCRRANTRFFFKQWGGRNKKAAGRLLNGRTWDAMPARSQPAGTGALRSPNSAGRGSSARS